MLDVRVEARRDLSAAEFKPLIDRLKVDFPQAEERLGFEVTAEFAPNKPPVSQASVQSVQGYFFWSGDRRDLAQFRVDGFTLNRLKPYQSWEVWFPRFVELWDLYVQYARPERATRVGVRCINHLALPPDSELRRFLRGLPVVPDLELPLAGIVSRLALGATSEPGTGVQLTQTAQQGAGGEWRVVLDVDAFTIGRFHANEVRHAFDPLHELRNRAFFESITSETVTLYQ